MGDRARKVGRRSGLKITRSRWHIENTAFNQWVKHWNLSHVYRHSANALMAVLLLWSLVFNLLQLFVYRRLKRSRRPTDPTDTIRHIVEVMLRDLGGIVGQQLRRPGSRRAQPPALFPTASTRLRTPEDPRTQPNARDLPWWGICARGALATGSRRLDARKPTPGAEPLVARTAPCTRRKPYDTIIVEGL